MFIVSSRVTQDKYIIRDAVTTILWERRNNFNRNLSKIYYPLQE